MVHLPGEYASPVEPGPKQTGYRLDDHREVEEEVQMVRAAALGLGNETEVAEVDEEEEEDDDQDILEI